MMGKVFLHDSHGGRFAPHLLQTLPCSFQEFGLPSWSFLEPQTKLSGKLCPRLMLHCDSKARKNWGRLHDWCGYACLGTLGTMA